MTANHSAQQANAKARHQRTVSGRKVRATDAEGRASGSLPSAQTTEPLTIPTSHLRGEFWMRNTAGPREQSSRAASGARSMGRRQQREYHEAQRLRRLDLRPADFRRPRVTL